MNKIKKKLLKICILTTISISSINCFAMKKNSEDIFKNNENYSSQELYYDENSYNSIKTPVNKIELNNREEELSLSCKINDEERLPNKNNEYLNKKTTRKNEEILKESKNSQNSYNQKDPNLIKTPVMKKRDLLGFQNNNDKNFNNINPFNMISNNICQYTSQKNNIIDSNSNKNKNSQDSYNQINFKFIQNLKNGLSANNCVINNNFEEKEKDNSSVKANFGENEDEKYLYEKNLGLHKISNEKELVQEEYKKRIICTILKEHLKNEVEQIIKKHIPNSTTENEKNINCNITINYNPLELPYDNLELKSSDFNILLPDNIKKIFKNKDEYIDLFLDIISNYKIILKKSIVEAFKELPKLKKEYFDKLRTERGTQQSCNKLIQKILGKQEFDNAKAYKELINFNRNDCLYQYFTNLKSLINSIHLKVLNKDNIKNSCSKNYKNIFTTDMSDDSTRIYYIDDIYIPEKKREIKFKDYDDFFKELNKIQFNS